jgi:hypothetical protein
MTVIIIHRAGKDASRGARAWSGLLAALDFELEVETELGANLELAWKTVGRSPLGRLPGAHGPGRRL